MAAFWVALMAAAHPSAASAVVCHLPILDSKCPDPVSLERELRADIEKAGADLTKATADKLRILAELNSVKRELEGLPEKARDAGRRVNEHVGLERSFAKLRDEAGKRLSQARRTLAEVEGRIRALDRVIEGKLDAATAMSAIVDKAAQLFMGLLDKLGLGNLGILDVDVRMTLNPTIKTSWTAFRLPDGSWIDTAKMDALQRGEFPTPDLHPIELVLRGIPFRMKEVKGWNDWWQRHTGATSRSFASSKRFTDWFGTDRAAKELGAAVVTGDKSASAAADEARRQIALEWADLISWAKAVGGEEGRALAAEMLKATLERRKPKPEGRAFTAGLSAVKYRMEVSFDDGRFGPAGRVLFRAAPRELKAVRASYDEHHIGFHAALTGPDEGMSPQAMAEAYVTRLRGRLDPVAEFRALVEKAGLGKEAAEWLLQTDTATFGDASAEKLANDMIGPEEAKFVKELVAATGKDFQVDLSRTSAKKRIVDAISSKVGSAKSWRIESIRLDLKTGGIRIDGKLPLTLVLRSKGDLDGHRLRQWKWDRFGRIAREQKAWRTLRFEGKGLPADAPAGDGYFDALERKTNLALARTAAEAEVSGWNRQLLDLSAEHDRALDELKRARDEIKSGPATKEALESRLATLEKELSEAEASVVEANALLDKLKRRLAGLHPRAGSPKSGLPEFLSPFIEPARDLESTFRKATENAAKGAGDKAAQAGKKAVDAGKKALNKPAKAIGGVKKPKL